MSLAPTRFLLLIAFVAFALMGDAAPTSAQLADPSAAKAAGKCQQAIAKTGATFVAATAKSLGACFDGTSDTCTDWSATTGSGSTGRSSFTENGFWSLGSQTCDVQFVRLYCVEQ